MAYLKPKTVLGFDLDGTLVERNKTEVRPEWLLPILNELDRMGHFSVPVTGKPSAYAMRILTENSLQHRGVIAENAGVYLRPGGTEPLVFGPGLEAVSELRELLGIHELGVTRIIIDGQAHEMVVDPEDASILTLFSRADAVRHRWEFHQTIGTEDLWEKLDKLIEAHGLNARLQLLPPFPDGGLQVIRRDELGEPIDKESLPLVIEALYELGSDVPIAMFGDGHNDIPAMKPASVIPLSFANAEEPVKEFVRTKQGFVSEFDAPDGNGVADGLVWLAQQGFFGADSERVSAIVRHGQRA
jgi:hypothetical protein